MKQGCILSPLLFVTALDIVFENINQRPTGINWQLNKKLCELTYADDIALLASSFQDMQRKLSALANAAQNIKCGPKTFGKQKYSLVFYE